MNTSALGRGLGSLIPPKPTPSATAQVLPEEAHRAILEVETAKIKENPRQPRKDFAPGDLEDLIQSVKEHGIIQPLVVTKRGDGYELVAGERRLRAARAVGLKTVPVVAREATEQQKLELAIIENVQRADLNPYEEALAYKALVDEFGLTQEEAAKRMGKSRPAIANAMRLLDLPDEMLSALREGKITKSHARTLLAETDAHKRRGLFARMLEGGVTVREAEDAVAPAGGRRARAAKDPNVAAHEKRLRDILLTKVQIDFRNGRGKIVIHAYSPEELLDLLDRFEKLS